MSPKPDCCSLQPELLGEYKNRVFAGLLDNTLINLSNVFTGCPASRLPYNFFVVNGLLQRSDAEKAVVEEMVLKEVRPALAQVLQAALPILEV
jgi:hypothetical protein